MEGEKTACFYLRERPSLRDAGRGWKRKSVCSSYLRCKLNMAVCITVGEMRRYRRYGPLKWATEEETERKDDTRRDLTTLRGNWQAEMASRGLHSLIRRYWSEQGTTRGRARNKRQILWFIGVKVRSGSTVLIPTCWRDVIHWRDFLERRIWNANLRLQTLLPYPTSLSTFQTNDKATK